MTKRFYSILALTLLGAATLFSCGGGESAEAAQQKADSIKADSVQKAEEAAKAAADAKAMQVKDSIKTDSIAKATGGANKKTATTTTPAATDAKGGTKGATPAPANNGGKPAGDVKPNGGGKAPEPVKTVEKGGKDGTAVTKDGKTTTGDNKTGGETPKVTKGGKVQ
ncbi:MAG: hypothetical protein ACKVTZ_09295 [Bacteroidia bacterium]